MRPYDMQRGYFASVMLGPWIPSQSISQLDTESTEDIGIERKRGPWNRGVWGDFHWLVYSWICLSINGYRACLCWRLCCSSVGVPAQKH